LDADNDKRRVIARQYLSEIQHPTIQIPEIKDFKAANFHVFPILSDQRDELQAYLTSKNIQTLIHYPVPPHKQNAYREWNQRSYPITEKIHLKELSLPVSPLQTQKETAYVCQCINQFQL